MDRIENKKNKIINFNLGKFFVVTRNRLWVTTVLFFVVLCVFVLSYSANLYLKIERGDAFSFKEVESNESSIQKIEEEDIAKIINYFTDKEVGFKSLLDGGVKKIIDPSI
ncbi:hypothetical protein A3E89_00790 [Candidatus Campbellbacteria bacterium RIFCSPHIGHO2_12_FULL_35_10]|uniref:Uncharacterized protein n=1 Tax=Candidatus Campbellbacteria bacterium RIFCSPHIGHO2_12_FULL_35_10 TaxID=1797578 RepID=A0A1F5EL03_9BACT|nr:MAG: hypothetical protein A3E89_00790 [Candidatus Campbellbacteria bacterium RIFCSPHIGHO2_12_FULL_35_10]